jgi:hypothetical protein
LASTESSDFAAEEHFSAACYVSLPRFVTMAKAKQAAAPQQIQIGYLNSREAVKGKPL